MYRTLLVPVATVVVLALTSCTAPPSDAPPTPTPTYDVETFFDTVSISGGSFSHDETAVLVTTDESGIFNVYSQPLSGDPRVQLTHSTTDATFSVSYFPFDDRFLFRADEGGNELAHLYVQEEDGSVKDLTPGERVVARFSDWNESRDAFFVQTNERDAKHFDLYRYAVDGYQREMIYRNEAGYFLGDVSADNRLLGLTKNNGNTDSDAFLLELASGVITQFTPEAEDVRATFSGFTPDGMGVLYGTNGEGEFRQVWRYDLETKERSVMAKDEWDVQSVNFSREGKYRVVRANVDASTAIAMFDQATGERIELPDLGSGDIVGVRFSASESKILLALNGDRSPTNLFYLNLEDPSAAPRQLTRSLSDEVAEDDLVDGEVVRFASYDGLEIPAILYRPKSASADRPAPAVLRMHGGPGGQSRHGYDPTIQHLVNHGYAVFSVNNRGSSGYGKTFFHLDDRKHGEADLDDCVAAKGYLQSLDWIDGEKIGIMGGSYGGYLVAAALAFRPEVFDVGIDIFGVTNWVRTLQNMPAWWGPQREALFQELGNPDTDLERLRRISPVFHGENIIKPLLVVQGKNDPRVLQIESDEIVAAVKANGVPVEYLIFDDEGHGFRNKANRITAQKAFLAFLDTYLRGVSDEAEPEGVASEGTAES